MLSSPKLPNGFECKNICGRENFNWGFVTNSLPVQLICDFKTILNLISCLDNKWKVVIHCISRYTGERVATSGLLSCV